MAWEVILALSLLAATVIFFYLAQAVQIEVAGSERKNKAVKFFFTALGLFFLILFLSSATNSAKNAISTGTTNTTNSYVNVTEVDTADSCTLGFAYPNNGTCSGVGANFAQTVTFKNVPVLAYQNVTVRHDDSNVSAGSDAAAGMDAVMWVLKILFGFYLLSFLYDSMMIVKLGFEEAQRKRGR